MFEPHYGKCTCGCGRSGIVAVKIGYITSCNNRIKKIKKKMASKYRIPKENIYYFPGESKQERIKATVKLKSQIDTIMGKEKKKKLKSINWLRDKCDELMSLIIRWESMDDNGFCICVTCCEKKHWKEIHNGHYIKRGRLWARYNFKNCHTQDVACNKFRDGNESEYAIFLEKKYGFGILQELNELANKNRGTFKREEYNATLRMLESRINSLTPPPDFNGTHPVNLVLKNNI